MPNNYTNLEIIPLEDIKEAIAKKLSSTEYKAGIEAEAKKFYGDTGGSINMGDIAIKRLYRKKAAPGLVFTLRDVAEYIGIHERTVTVLQRKLGIVPLRARYKGIQKYRNFYTMYDVLKILNHYFVRRDKKK